MCTRMRGGHAKCEVRDVSRRIPARALNGGRKKLDEKVIYHLLMNRPKSTVSAITVLLALLR